jgi:hypothetical protein
VDRLTSRGSGAVYVRTSQIKPSAPHRYSGDWLFTTSQQPTLGTRQSVAALNDVHPRPVISDTSPVPVTHGQPLSAIQRLGGDHGCDRLPRRSSGCQTGLRSGSVLLTGHRLLPPRSSGRTDVRHETTKTYGLPARRVPSHKWITVHVIPHGPGHGHAVRPGLLQHMYRSPRLGLEGYVCWHAGHVATLLVSAPLWRQMETPRDRCARPTQTRQKDAQLAVLYRAGYAHTMPLDAH